MKWMIGDEGTEQFTVTTRINGKLLKEQAIHDPFATTRVSLRGFVHAWRALTKGIEVQVSIGGSEGASRAIMTLDPMELQVDTEAILRGRAEARKQNEANGVHGYYAAVTSK